MTVVFVNKQENMRMQQNIIEPTNRFKRMLVAYEWNQL